MRLVSRFVVYLLLMASAASAAWAQSLPTADLIVVVDTSGSMAEEVGQILGHLNSMVDIIRQSEIDLHVILISDRNQMCVLAPLGSGSCPDDESLPAFRHVSEPVGSRDALSKLIDTYSQWSGSLRSSARKFILVASDDDSDLPAASFNSMLLTRDPTFSDYIFSGFVCAESQYHELIIATGGTAAISARSRASHWARPGG